MADFSTGTIYGTNNSNQLEITNNVLVIGMTNSRHIAEQWDSPSTPLQEI